MKIVDYYQQFPVIFKGILPKYSNTEAFGNRFLNDLLLARNGVN